MTNFSPFRLQTERLLLRPLAQTDVDELFAMYSDTVAMRYWSCCPWTTMLQAEEFVEDALQTYSDGTQIRLGLVLLGDNRLAGQCSMYGFDSQNRRAEIGYMLSRDAWGKGYMTEAMTSFIDYAFAELNLNRLEADIDPRNTRSEKLLQRLAFLKEGHFRERWIVEGEVCNSDMYGLLKSDWEKR